MPIPLDTPPADPARLRAGIDWIVLIAAVAAIAITARMGWWQITRGQTKATLHAQITQRMAQEPLTLAELPSDAAGLAERVHRRVELSGEWLPEHTVFLENRQMRGRPGFFVVTPLRLPAGDALLVQRGWLPRHPSDRSVVPPVATETGPVRLSGRLAPPPSRLYEFDTAASGAIRQNLDLTAHAAAIGVSLRPYSVLQLDDGGAATPVASAGAAGAGPALLRDWPQPQADVHKHYAYALQWFLMSVVIAGLYVWFRILLPRRRDRAARAAG